MLWTGVVSPAWWRKSPILDEYNQLDTRRLPTLVWVSRVKAVWSKVSTDSSGDMIPALLSAAPVFWADGRAAGLRPTDAMQP